MTVWRRSVRLPRTRWGGRPRRGHPCLRPAYSEFNSGDLAKHKPGRPFASDSMENGGSEGAGSLAQTSRLDSLCLAECERHAPPAQRSGWVNSRGRWQLQQCRASSIDQLSILRRTVLANRHVSLDVETECPLPATTRQPGRVCSRHRLRPGARHRDSDQCS